MKNNFQAVIDNYGDTSLVIESDPDTKEVSLAFLTEDQMEAFEGGEEFDTEVFDLSLEEASDLIFCLRGAIAHAEQNHEYME